MTETPGNLVSAKARRRADRKAVKHSKQAHRKYRPMKALTPAQDYYISVLRDADQVFAVGGAGTGKTYIAARHAMKQVLDDNKDRLIITRPTVSKAKHALGFLPGSLEDKIGPWLTPLLDAMKDEASPALIDKMIKSGQIEFLGFEHMRGRSLRDAIIILDEAQNCDFGDLRMFLTRIGENSQVIITGDLDQCDIPDSGLEKVVDMIEEYFLSADVVKFDENDVVRSEIAREWVEAFGRHSP